MKRFLIILIIASICIVALSADVAGQICGDVDNDGSLNILDMAYYLDWLTAFGPSPPIVSLSDIDDKSGSTIADIVRLSDYFFYNPANAPDCNPGDVYDYEISNADTVFLPVAFADPSVVNEVELPIVTSFSDSVIGMYLVVFNNGSENSGHYKAVSTWYSSGGSTPINLSHNNADSSFFALSRIATSIVSGVNTFFSIIFDTTGMAGSGYIAVDKVDRSSEWRSCIAKKNGQLYLPIFAVMTHTYNHLIIDDAGILYALPLGIDSSAAPTVRDITSNNEMISWEAEADTSWIVLDKTAGQTPDQIQISIDKTGLNYGWHRGSVTIWNSDYPRTFPRTIGVSLHIGPVNYAGIDANCDGNFNVGDVTYLIDYLFGDPIGPPPCEPCPAAVENYPPMDLNCDGKTNITDVVRAMRYLYEVPYGAVPCDRCTQ